eukprot:GFUD01117024.1.p1 GENE.GFUD01117024.1~~GFUD01117024.1.p1  ORF type:complete len:399 (-),score=129.25 GFUD01117024.1:449-1645(-)
MGDKSKHSFRWDHTENALTFWSTFVTRNIGNQKDRLYELFLQNPCYATEKYDGTNIAKDDGGQIYSRSLLIDEGEKDFNKINLKKVKEADVAEFRNQLTEVAVLDPDDLNKCLVYGEFICNGYYDYPKRSILGDWKVFGATVEVKRKPEETLEKLLIAGFAAVIKSSNKQHILLFTNEKFVEIAKQANMDVPENKGCNVTIAEVIARNKDGMKKGLLEGIVMTIHDKEFGHKILKWKGAQEFQPIASEKAQEANEMIQSEDVHDNLKTAFKQVCEVITDISENKTAMRLAKKAKKIQEKDKPKPNQGNPGKKYLTNLDKEMIQDGIIQSQKKFDSVEKYKIKGDIEEYKGNLINEVKKHMAEENSNLKEIDENILSFIKHKVNAVIKAQLATDDKTDK